MRSALKPIDFGLANSVYPSDYSPQKTVPRGFPRLQQELVAEALRDIVGSDVFRRSARMIRFLHYVVSESLSPEPRLNERHIAMAVFDRQVDWEPKLDPIVRIEARRLREKLSQYYASLLRNPPVVFALPKGGYKVEFCWHAQREMSTVTSSPSAAIQDPIKDTPAERSALASARRWPRHLLRLLKAALSGAYRETT